MKMTHSKSFLNFLINEFRTSDQGPFKDKPGPMTYACSRRRIDGHDPIDKSLAKRALAVTSQFPTADRVSKAERRKNGLTLNLHGAKMLQPYVYSRANLWQTW